MTNVGLMIVAITIPVILFYSFRANYNTLKLLFLICFFQNVCIVMISPYISKADYTIIVLLKEIMTCAAVTIAFVRKMRVSLFELFCMASIFILLLYTFLYSSEDFTGNVVSFRQLYIPFMFYLFGRTLHLNREEFQNSIKFFVKLCVFACVFGLVEQLIGDGFWEMMNIKEYLMIKYDEITIVKGHVNLLAAYSYDFYSIFGIVLKRMCSILVDSVIFAQLLAFACIVVTFKSDITFNKKKLLIILLYAGLIFTLGKGGILIAGLSGAYLLRENRQMRVVSDIVMLICIVAIGLLLNHSVETNSSGAVHLAGLVENIKDIFSYPLGRGIGSVGNLAAGFGDAAGVTEQSGESFIGALIGQMGFIGIFLYGIFLYGINKELKRKCIKYENNRRIFRMIRVLMNCMFISSLINNTAISFTSCFIYFILAGVEMQERGPAHSPVPAESGGNQ